MRGRAAAQLPTRLTEHMGKRRCNPHKQNETFSITQEARLIQQLQSRRELALPGLHNTQDRAAHAAAACCPVKLRRASLLLEPSACLAVNHQSKASCGPPCCWHCSCAPPPSKVLKDSPVLALPLLAPACSPPVAAAAVAVAAATAAAFFPLSQSRSQLPTTAAQETLTWTLVSDCSGKAHTVPRTAVQGVRRCPPARRRSPPAKPSGAGCWVAHLHITHTACLGCSSLSSLQGQNYQPKTFTDGQTLKFTWTGGCRRRCAHSVAVLAARAGVWLGRATFWWQLSQAVCG